jgi:regulator of replication initiation timing/molybdopterin converting factor small subunit
MTLSNAERQARFRARREAERKAAEGRLKARISELDAALAHTQRHVGDDTNIAALNAKVAALAAENAKLKEQIAGKTFEQLVDDRRASAAASGSMPEQAERLRALWKSGRDKYVSFFAVLSEVKREVGDDKLSDWCFYELRIPLPVIVRAHGLLTEADAARVKADLAAATKKKPTPVSGDEIPATDEALRAELEKMKRQLTARNTRVKNLQAEMLQVRQSYWKGLMDSATYRAVIQALQPGSDAATRATALGLFNGWRTEERRTRGFLNDVGRMEHQ